MKLKDILEFAKWDTPEERKKKKQHIEVEEIDLTEEEKKLYNKSPYDIIKHFREIEGDNKHTYMALTGYLHEISKRVEDCDLDNVYIAVKIAKQIAGFV